MKAYKIHTFATLRYNNSLNGDNSMELYMSMKKY